LVFPYALDLSPAFAKVFTPFVLFVQLIQTLIEFSIAIYVGLYLAFRLGFGCQCWRVGFPGKKD
jgi:hypothetical protein